jgi:DNA polymerase-3 subunit alpha
MRIEVLPPDINESYGEFSVVTKELSGDNAEKIRFGLYSIKNFGQGIADTIIEERKANGPYQSLEDFLRRVTDRNLNRKSLESLIQSGSLDRFGERGHLLANIDMLLSYHREAATRGAAQDSLFSGATMESISRLSLAPGPAATQAQMLSWEKELLGLYVSGHPLDAHKTFLANTQTTIAKLRDLPSGMTTVVYGLVEDVRPILTRKNEKMAFVRLSDYTGTLEVVLFPKTFTTCRDIVTVGACIGVKGKISPRNGELSLVADHVKKI